MENSEVTDLRQYNLSLIKPIGFIDQNKLKSALDQLSEIRSIVIEMLEINEKLKLPPPITGKITSFNNAILNFYKQIEKTETGGPDQIARTKDQYLTQINQYYSQCFNIEKQNNTNRLIEYYSIVKSFNQNNEEVTEEIDRIKNDFLEKIKESQEVIDNLKNNSSESESILNELKKKISSQTVSDYAIVFENEASKYKKLSENWIKTGIILSIVFVVLIIVVASFQILPSETYSAEGDFLRYNFSNLLTKLIVIAVLIFLMSFSFKQYSINKHLQTLNTHRQNALNSYQLFTKSIVGDDTNSRNALMIQVAKAIYEHTQSTGFLNEKGQNVNSGIVELTKIIGKNNTI